MKTIEQFGPDFEFLQVMRLLELNAAEGVLHLNCDQSVCFPATDIRSCLADGDRFEMRLAFAGLYGIDSPLPHYMIDICSRDNERGECLRRFLDIFNRRIYQLFYLAWRKCHLFLYTDSNKGAQDTPDMSYIDYLKSLSCHMFDDYDGREFAFAGLLGARTHNHVSLKTMLSAYLDDLEVTVRSNVLYWALIFPVHRMGDTDRTLALGDNMVLGGAVLDFTSKIDIHIGPLTWQQVIDLLPGNRKAQRLGYLVARYLGPTLRSDIVLVVVHPERGCLMLGSTVCLLGWSACLGAPGHDTIRIRYEVDRVVGWPKF